MGSRMLACMHHLQCDKAALPVQLPICLFESAQKSCLREQKNKYKSVFPGPSQRQSFLPKPLKTLLLRQERKKD
jgi:hypothetical protein